MRFTAWVKSWFGQERNTSKDHLDGANRPLREFVYLDEVSLRSLLSSQTGEVVESTSEQFADEHQTEVGGTIGVSSPLIAKSELTSRFQTSNSSTIQTSRKATVQSWFGDFHRIPDIRLVEPPSQTCKTVNDTKELLSITDTSIVVKAEELLRGSLVEFRVKLTSDPVFRLGTMVSEFTGMAEDFPQMFEASGALAALVETQPINKILQRLLAGLIPIRAEALDYAVVTIGGVEYVAHRDAIAGLDLEEKPLEIVGVTEHLAYWKDIRRVLFSDAEFIMMGRVSRSALQPSWTPVKLVDLFSELTPDLVEQISKASLLPFNDDQQNIVSDSNEDRLAIALGLYKNAMLKEMGKTLTKKQNAQIEDEIIKLQTRVNSASDQRSAFLVVSDLLCGLVDARIDPSKDLEFRDTARNSSGLSLFPSTSPVWPTANVSATEDKNHAQPRLLDVEIIAIYW